MAVTAKKDWDRLSNALASGNVVSGADTLSGNAGKDVPGVAPNKVTLIQFEATILPVNAGGADLFGDHGMLHINPDGSYTYTRLQVEVGDVAAGATDVFTYTFTDKNGANSTATLTIEVLPETMAAPDGKGLHKGTAFDDFIDGSFYFTKTADGMVTIDGGEGQDKIIGSGFYNNHLIGGAGNDFLIGNDGDDLLEGGAGTDRLDGDKGKDIASYSSSKAGVTVDLTDNNKNAGGDAAGDILLNIDGVIGSAFADTLTGNGGNNTLKGGNGNDTLKGGVGFDALYGGAGNDSLFGDTDGDFLFGGAGADTLDGGLGSDRVSYEDAASKVTVNLSNLAANSGDAKGDSYISIEQFTGSLFNDTLIGSDAADVLLGLAGNDTIDGGKSGDALSGNLGTDTIHGGDGDDTIDGDEDNDKLFGDDGKDTINGNDGADTLDGGADNDTLVGENGDDLLLGGAGNDQLDGGADNDVLEGGLGADKLEGGTGFDLASYRNATAAVVADMIAPRYSEHRRGGRRPVLEYRWPDRVEVR